MSTVGVIVVDDPLLSLVVKGVPVVVVPGNVVVEEPEDEE